MVAASPRNSFGSHNSNTRTARPASISLRAATKPSPPLFPFPQTTPTRCACPKSDRMKRATAAPAFSIRMREETPKCSEVARSISRISAALTIFIGRMYRSTAIHLQEPSIARRGPPRMRQLVWTVFVVHGRALVAPPHAQCAFLRVAASLVRCAPRLVRCCTMPTLIANPTRIESAGNKPKIIEEYVGSVKTATTGASVARMQSPEGWEEPGQTPEFDEYTLILH